MPGAFTFTITSEQLSRGLRPSKRLPRDSKYLVESKGALGRDGVLAAIDKLERLDTSVIKDVFPYPQIFVFINFVLVCGETEIYEYSNKKLTLVFTASRRGSTWTAVDFYDYIYMSNGKVAVVRNPDTGEYSETSLLPTAASILNFNGQVILGASDVPLWRVFPARAQDPFVVSLSIDGAWGEINTRIYVVRWPKKTVARSRMVNRDSYRVA